MPGDGREQLWGKLRSCFVFSRFGMLDAKNQEGVLILFAYHSPFPPL